MPEPADLPVGLSSSDLYELARIGWERGNEISDIPTGYGYGWDEIDAATRAAAMEETRVVLVEWERRKRLRAGKAADDA